MTDQEAIKYLASKIGEMTVRIAARYQIKYNDNSGFFGLIPEYGETFDEALKNTVLAKFGDEYLNYAEKMQLDEISSSRELAKRIIEQEQAA